MAFPGLLIFLPSKIVPVTSRGWGGSTIVRFESVPYLCEYVCKMCLWSDGRVEKGRCTNTYRDKGTLQLYIVDTVCMYVYVSTRHQHSNCAYICEHKNNLKVE